MSLSSLKAFVTVVPLPGLPLPHLPSPLSHHTQGRSLAPLTVSLF